MNVIELKEKCKRCNGTGLYVGMAERNGAAIVCRTCEGTGCHNFRHEYEEFTGRVDRKNIKRVYAVNPGISIGEGNGHRLEDFGGMSFEEWKQGRKFIPGAEDRKHSCPAWWYQTADYEKKPDWDECMDSLGRTFSSCKHFCKKEKCWRRWDAEFTR